MLTLHNNDPTITITFFSYSFSPFSTFLHSKKQTLAHTLSSILWIAVVAGPSSSSVPDDLTDDVALPFDQSSKPRGEDAAQGNDK